MSIVRVDIPASYTHGWQARGHVTKGLPRLSKFIADSYRGKARGWHIARWHEARLIAQAKRMRGELPGR